GVVTLPAAAELFSQRTGPVVRLAPLRIVVPLSLVGPGALAHLISIDRWGSWPWRAAKAAISVLLLCGALVVQARVLEGRKAHELGLRHAGTEWLVGVGIGAALFSVALGVLVALGGYRVSSGLGWSALVPSILNFW